MNSRNLTDEVSRDVSLVPGAAPEPAAPGELEFIATPGGRAARACVRPHPVSRTDTAWR